MNEQTTTPRNPTRLRRLLAEPGMILAPFVFDALQAEQRKQIVKDRMHGDSLPQIS